ncbi:heme utilization protein [Pseudomonas sp. CCI3.2]|uniref:heme utilization protein n=1 Tax=unclassified Pseudomonas TaxID=196821 RepID=UPI002AC8D039|nr:MULTISPECIES: heme utilization protein [unclassified Pseudomonas]MEB0076184.1 heme utilization protein [Pseudomonas sp. MH10out]MEB0090679.1 heme utilization protein [Pseudomonas sp. CCI4.2]MEB0100643.1 heme utilization protein [Pseudomonas sp. CCI3.2]MEB0131854.1 heme utilization protein [Pseudomonas sp. CCI2.4]MEB0156063.1 heme utilization protein [Pseudomonas sp. AH2 (2023)]
MKPTMAIKPLVFALAAVLAVAAQAAEHGSNDHRGNDNDPSPLLSLLVNAGSAATVMDSQSSHDNTVLNQGTQNNATVEGSASNANGNLGINVAGGDANQQDNAAAIATADESFIFGSAISATSATQTNTGNAVGNYSTHSNASLSNSANSSSGNVGVNVTSGDYNQQKNNLAIAVSGGRVASASASANQTSSATSVGNYATQTFDKVTLKDTVDVTGTYKGKGEGTVANNEHGGWGGERSTKDKLAFTESGTVELSGVATYQVLTPSGWANPVTNSASLSNSLNNVSGNVGANVAAGIGNQQSNSLSIAAGCKACM